MRFRISAFIVIAFCLLLLVAGNATYAQQMTPAQWTQLKNDKAFGYKNDREKIVKPRESKPGPLQHFVNAILDFLGGGAGNVLAWIVVALAVLYVSYRLTFHRGFLFAKSGKPARDSLASADPEDVATTDWEALLQQAVAGNDLRLAVRYSYMWLLQLLGQQQLIQYRQDKTNYEYYGELQGTPYKQSFGRLSRMYEYAWYGKFPVQPIAYDEYISIFNTVKKDLNA